MNVAITGVCGLLGSHLAAALSREHRVVGFDRHPWWGPRPITLHTGDLADDAARAAFLDDARPDLLIHCAAMVNVDACEERPDQAYFVNGTLTRRLVRGAPVHCRLVYVSTDGIFDGDTPMRRETDLPCPRTVYGRSKLHGEWEIQLAAKRHLIVRTNFFGWSSGAKSTAAEWLYNALATREPITLFHDFWFTPIYVVDLVERVLALVAAERTGIYNVAGRDRVSKHEFAMRLAARAGLPIDAVRRGSIADARLRAPRPRDMSLDSAKLTGTTGIAAPACDEGLGHFVADRGTDLDARTARVSPTARQVPGSQP